MIDKWESYFTYYVGVVAGFIYGSIFHWDWVDLVLGVVLWTAFGAFIRWVKKPSKTGDAS